MNKNKIMIYWVLLFTLLFTSTVVLFTGSAQARYNNTVTTVAVMQTPIKGITSNCLVTVTEAARTILLGEIEEEEIMTVPFWLLSSGIDQTLKLNWGVSDPAHADYLSIAVKSGNEILKAGEDIELLEDIKLDLELCLIPTEIAFGTSHAETKINVHVTLGDAMWGTFQVILPAVEILVEEPSAEESIPKDETTESGENNESTESSESSEPDPEDEITESEETNESTESSETTESSAPIESVSDNDITEYEENIATTEFNETTETKETTESSAPIESVSDNDITESEETIATTESNESIESSAPIESAPEDEITESEETIATTESNESTESSVPSESASEEETMESETTESGENDTESEPTDTQSELNTIPAFDLTQQLPVMITLADHITSVRLGIQKECEGTVPEDEITEEIILEALPDYTMFSVDGGANYYMVYGDVIPEFVLHEVTSVRLLLDFRYTELKRDAELNIAMETYMGDKLQKACTVNTVANVDCKSILFEKNADAIKMQNMLGHVLNFENILEFTLPMEWKETELGYSVEFLTMTDNQTLQYVPVELSDDRLQATYRDEDNIHKLELRLGKKFAQPGTYRINIFWSYEGLCYNIIQQPFFVNCSGREDTGISRVEVSNDE